MSGVQHSADVVIVGGGLMGVASAFFLRKRGLSVVLLVKTMVLPSGEKVAAPAPFGRSVMAFGSPPVMGIRKS